MNKKPPQGDDSVAEFNPNQHWRSFEYLSLEVLSVMLEKENLPCHIIKRDVTKETRDCGVDGFIRFRVSDSDREYTVEAKLRAKNKIALRDIATSILYFLIGFSDRHFIVTNVIFTAEALRVIEEIRRRLGGALETIDGHELRRLLNEGLTSREKGVPELIRLLQKQPIPPREPPAPRGTAYYRVIKEYYPIKRRTELRDQVICQLNAGKKLFLIRGEPGTGKSQLIWDIAKESEKYQFEICRIDMSKIYSPRIFILQTLRLILGLNLNDLLDQLDGAGRQHLEQNPALLECVQAGDYGRAVRYLLTSADDNLENRNYLLRCLLSELSERCFHQTKGLLILEGLDDSEEELIRYLLYVLDILAGERSGLSVLIKLTIFRNRSETGRIPFDEWNRLVNIMERFRISGQPPSIITLGNLSEYEARDILEKSLPLPRVPLYYENAILSRAGTNPRALFSLIFLIRAQQLFTQYDIERLPPDCGGSIQSAYIGALLEDGGSGPYFRALLAALCELEGSLPLSLNVQLEREYSVQPGTFAKTGVIAESPTALEIESRQVLAAVRQALDIETVQAARRWILKHLDLARWKEPDRSSRELLLKLRLREYVSDTLLESVLDKLREEKFRGRSEELLLEAYHVRREAEDFLSALDYLLRYLDRLSLRDKLNTAEYQELLSDADRMAVELTVRNNALPVKAHIRLCFLHYWQSKSRYDYEGCVRCTDEILKMEEACSTPEGSCALEKYWIKAHIFRALNFKERGSRHRCVRAFWEALRRYPQSEELRISCYMNLAGLTYHTAPQTARHFLGRALELVESRNGSGGNRWLWLYNDRILCGLFSGGGDLEEIRAARERADHQYSLSNLARTFAFEACVHYDRGDLGLAETFFSKAIQVGTVQGGTKPSFLFLTDVIAVKLLAGKDVAQELEEAQQWLMEHFDTVMEKIDCNRMRGADHLFAAVVSWVISVQKTERADLERPFQHRWEGSSRLPYTVFQTENVHRDFLRRGTIIVLF